MGNRISDRTAGKGLLFSLTGNGVFVIVQALD